MRKLLCLIVVILIIFSGVVYIDYFLVKTQNKTPKISIKEKVTDKNMIVYKAIFYKVWYCENDKKFVIGSYDDPDATCTSDIKFDDGYYTNESGAKISKRDYAIMRSSDIYTDESIKLMSSNDVINAVYVASEYESKKYKVYREFTGLRTVHFPSFNEKTLKWEYNDDNPIYYCLYDDNTISQYISGSGCSSDKVPFKFDSKFCSLYENSTIKTFDEWNNNYCN